MEFLFKPIFKENSIFKEIYKTAKNFKHYYYIFRVIQNSNIIRTTIIGKKK